MWNSINQIVRQLSIVTIGYTIANMPIAPCTTAVSSNTSATAAENPIDKTTQLAAQHNLAATDKSIEYSASTPGPQNQIVEIYDGRNLKFKAEISITNIARALIHKAVQNDKNAIGQNNKFNCELKNLEEVRVIGRAEGSFTHPNTNQSAFLYELCQAGRTFGLGGIIVFEKETVVAHYIYGENGLMSGMLSARDINRNGLTEIILTFGHLNQGYAGNGISLFELRGGNLNYLGRTSTYSDNSGAVTDDRTKVQTRAYKISVRPSANPIFLQDTYEARGRQGEWSLIQKAQPFSLAQGTPDKFVKIR